MIVTLTGENQYLIDQELNRLKADIDQDEASLAITTLEGQEVSLDQIELEFNGFSLFSAQRLVILNQPSKVKGFDEYIQEATDFDQNLTIVIVEPTLDRRRTYYKYLKNKTDFQEFKTLETPELIRWIINYAKEQGGTVSSGDASYLINRVGDDQLLLSQELSKLIIYSSAITRQTIDLLTEQSAASTIFELLDAAFSLNSQKALTIYNDQRLQKVEPEQILAMISWQLNVLGLYKTSTNLPSNQVVATSGLSPYSLSKARQVGSKIALSDLKQQVSELCQLDFKSKTSAYDLDEGLKNFIVGLSV